MLDVARSISSIIYIYILSSFFAFIFISTFFLNFTFVVEYI